MIGLRIMHNAVAGLVVLFAFFAHGASVSAQSSVGSTSDVSCISDLRWIYLTPHLFDGKRVCAGGQIRLYRDEILLVPPTFDQDDLRYVRAILVSTDPSVNLPELQPDDYVWFDGTIDLHLECVDDWATPEIIDLSEVVISGCQSGYYRIRILAAEIEVIHRRPEDQRCLHVDIETLFATPREFSNLRICTEAMINVEYEGMKLYPPALQQMPYSDTQMNLYIGLPLGEALSRDLRNRDWVSAEGRFSIDEACFPRYLGETGDSEIFCFPSRLGYLSSSTIMFLRREDPRDTCDQIDLATFEIDAERDERSVICTRGRIAVHNSDLYVVAEGTATGFDITRTLEINELFLDPEDWNLLPGDIVSVAGEVDGNNISLFEIEVLEREPPWDMCMRVEIAELYANPLNYADQMICTEGYLSFDETNGSLLLPSEDYDAMQPALGRIDIGWVFPEPEHYYEGPGENVRVVGLLRAHRACRSEDLTLQDLRERYAEEQYCPPVNIPLSMDITEIEYLER